MSPTPPPPSGPSSGSEELSAEIRALRDLFQRRLLDDRAKNQLIDAVQEHLTARAALDSGEAFRSLITEALLAVDRLVDEEPSAELCTSVAAELLEVFGRRGLRPVPTEGAADPRLHEIVRVVSASPTLSAPRVAQDEGAGQEERMAQGEPAENTIVEVHRRGYTLGERLLRPAQVVVIASKETTDG